LFMLFLYPIGIPTLFFTVLYRNRKKLTTPDVLTKYGFMYEAYSAKFWFFELADMANKLFLTSIIIFFPNGLQPGAGMVWSVSYIILILVFFPYVRKIDDRLHTYAQLHLFFILLIGYVLQQTPFEIGSAVDVFASFILLCLLFSLFILVLYHGFVFVKKFVRNQQRINKIKQEEHLTDNPLTPSQHNGQTVIQNPLALVTGVNDNLEMDIVASDPSQTDSPQSKSLRNLQLPESPSNIRNTQPSNFPRSPSVGPQNEVSTDSSPTPPAKRLPPPRPPVAPRMVVPVPPRNRVTISEKIYDRLMSLNL